MNWRQVWLRRKLPAGREAGLRDLIDLDGFDTGAGRIETADWQAYALAVAALLGLTSGDSVFEVGCGAGAFLFALREQLELRVGGADYSPSLIAAARRTLPEGAFEVLEASELPPEPAYDFVLANSVFHYFPDLEYAQRVLERMIAKSKRVVAVLEVPDLSLRAAAERLRSDRLSAEEYDRKYAGLEHLYYARDWFVRIAATREFDCRLVPSPIPNSAQAEFRFGALLSKR